MADISTTDGGRVLVATGLALEARIAADPDVVTVCSGGDPSRLRSLLAATTPRTVHAVISFGLAGGVDPALRAGDVVIATDVVSGAARWPTDERVTLALAARLTEGRTLPRLGRMAGSDAVVSAPAAKSSLYATGAAAVDMESHVAAEFAATHGLPFGVVRVICDPAGRTLPPLAQHALGAQGHVSLAAIFRSLVRDPSQIGALIGLGRDFATAAAALRRSRRLLGPRFGLADAGDLMLDVT
jgi:adenosylhomocysteine nucleosidase